MGFEDLGYSRENAVGDFFEWIVFEFWAGDKFETACFVGE